MTHHWPVRDNLRRRGSTSSPQSSILLLTVPKSPFPTGKPCSTHAEGLHTDNRQKLRREQNVLRCSGTPRISGKLFTGLSVGRTAALCIIVIQTGRQTHTHTPATPWAHSPVQPCGEKKVRRCWCWGLSPELLRCPVKPLSLFLFPGMMSVPCRAELFWSESDRLLGPFSAAGAAGPDVTAAEAQQGPIGAQEEEAPRGRKASSIGVQARRRKERRRGV